MKGGSPWMEKWMKGLTDFFLLCSFFSFLPSRCTLMDHHNHNSHHPPSPSLLSPFFLFFNFLSSLSPLLLSFPPTAPVCACDSALCTRSLFLGVTAVHSPVPYCGAVHHLHAFSVLQQNEFLIGPERGERSTKRRWLFLLSPYLCVHAGMSQCKPLITVSTPCLMWH